jgi:hypothetical protein
MWIGKEEAREISLLENRRAIKLFDRYPISDAKLVIRQGTRKILPV